MRYTRSHELQLNEKLRGLCGRRQARGHGHAHIIQPCIQPRLSPPTLRATIHTRIHILEQLLLSNALMPMLNSFIIAVFISPVAEKSRRTIIPMMRQQCLVRQAVSGISLPYRACTCIRLL